MDDGTANVINLFNQEITKTIPSSLGEHSVSAIAITPGKKHLFVGEQLWNIESGELVREFGKNLIKFEDIKISPDGEWVATKHRDLTLHIWRTEDLIHSTASINHFQNY